MKHAELRRPEAIMRVANFAGDKERIENAVFRQSRIHCDVTFDQGTAVITPRGKETGSYSAFIVAKSIANKMGFEAKQGW